MPDLWDTNPHNAFSTPDEQPEPAPSGHDDDHTKEVTLRDHRGHLRPPAYVLIALVIALVAILLLLVGVLVAPSSAWSCWKSCRLDREDVPLLGRPSRGPPALRATADPPSTPPWRSNRRCR